MDHFYNNLYEASRASDILYYPSLTGQRLLATQIIESRRWAETDRRGGGGHLPGRPGFLLAAAVYMRSCPIRVGGGLAAGVISGRRRTARPGSLAQGAAGQQPAMEACPGSGLAFLGIWWS
jgi:hypothetical protein